MNTALGRRLTTEQYEKLITAACARRKEVIAAQECQEWTTRRERYERIAAGDHWYRLSCNGYNGAVPGGGGIPQIFDRINETLGIIQSVRRFLVARVCKDLFGSRPYFSVQPEGAVDQDLALKLQQHADWKLRMADYTTRIKEAVGIALDLGECPIKTTWEKEVDVSERLATLLTHATGSGPSAGQPVLTADGDHIEDSDETTGGDQALDGQGMPVKDEDGEPVINPIRFKKAPEIQMDPAKHEWREHFVDEQTVLYQGLNIAACHWRDVHWPINAPSLAKADFVSHTFDARWSALRAKYAGAAAANGKSKMENGTEAGDGGGGDVDESMSGDAEVLRILESIRSSSRAPKSHESLPRPGEAEVMGGEVDDPIIQVCEVSYDYDCFEDGIVRRLWLVLLPEFDQCLFADFRANVSPRAAKPIHLVTVNQVKHRAYGKGLHETYEKMANVADGLLCSILYKNKINSDPTKIWNPDRTNEGAANPTLVIEPGRTYSIKGSQWGPKDILACVEVPDLDDRTWKLMELFMQLIQVDSGVTNANQGDMTDLPSNATATGVNSMLESSSVLHQYVLEEIRDSLTPHLGYALELIYKMQDRNETFDYLEQDATPRGTASVVGPDGAASARLFPGPPPAPTLGGSAGGGDKVTRGGGEVQPPSPGSDPAVAGLPSSGMAPAAQRTIEAIMELSDAKKLNGLPMKVEFLLTRAKRQEQREAAMAAIPIGVQYGSLPPKDQARMRECFVQLFRALGFDHPDDFFPMPDLTVPPPQPPPPKATEAIALNGSNLAPNQLDALAQQFGLPPAQGLPGGDSGASSPGGALPAAGQNLPPGTEGGSPFPGGLPPAPLRHAQGLEPVETATPTGSARLLPGQPPAPTPEGSARLLPGQPPAPTPTGSAVPSNPLPPGGGADDPRIPDNRPFMDPNDAGAMPPAQ